MMYINIIQELFIKIQHVCYHWSTNICAKLFADSAAKHWHCKYFNENKYVSISAAAVPGQSSCWYVTTLTHVMETSLNSIVEDLNFGKDLETLQKPL